MLSLSKDMKAWQLSVLVFLVVGVGIWAFWGSRPEEAADNSQINMQYLEDLPEKIETWPDQTKVIKTLNELQRAGKAEEVLGFVENWTSHPSSMVRSRVGALLAENYEFANRGQIEKLKTLLDEQSQEVRVGVLRGFERSWKSSTLEILETSVLGKGRSIDPWTHLLALKMFLAHTEDLRKAKKYLEQFSARKDEFPQDPRFQSTLEEMYLSAENRNI